MRHSQFFTDCDLDPPTEAIEVDVCIVGTGPAGLIAALTLATRGLSVAMIERGNHTARQPFNRHVVFDRERYEGIVKGIAFGWGGTSALWGGQLLPMLEVELASMGAPWNEPGYQHELAMSYAKVEALLGVTTTSYDPLSPDNPHQVLRKLVWGELFPLQSKWIPFRRRHLGALLLGKLVETNKVRVFLQCEPVEWSLSDVAAPSAQIDSLAMSNRSGKRFQVKAQHYGFAAGALETPLMLQRLMGAEQASQVQIGSKLHDHISVRIAELHEIDRRAFESRFVPVFEGQTMRSLRMCFRTARDAADIAYLHFVIEAPENSGFAVLRDILRGLQARNPRMVMRGLAGLPRASFDLARLIGGRIFQKKLGLPKGARVFVNLDFVQSPVPENKVSNDSTALGAVRVSWAIDPAASSIVAAGLNKLREFWLINQLESTAKIKALECEPGEKVSKSNIYDIYHPAGTCSQLNSRSPIGVPKNITVLGSAVFPRLGASNPTLTILAIAILQAETILAKRGKA